MINNLNYPVERFMFNTALGSDEYGLYASTRRGRLMFSLKKEGLALPGFVATSVSGAAPAPGAGSLPTTILGVSKSVTSAGTINGGIIWLKNEAPCEDCNFSYHLNFRKEVERPGETNMETNQYYRYYGGSIKRPSITGNVIDDETMLAIEDDLITQITSDYISTDLIDKHDRAICEARRVYVVTDNANNDVSAFTVTKPDGTTATFTSDGAFDNLDDKVNATNYLKAYKIGKSGTVSTYLITSVNKGYLFTLEAGTDTTIVKHGIYYKGISADVRAIPSFDVDFGEIELLSIVTIAGNTGKIRISGAVGGVQFSQESAAFTSGTVGTRVGVINTANTGAYNYFASAQSTTVVVVALGIKTFKVKNTNSGTNTITYVVNDFGTWPYLTGEDVFRLFALRPQSFMPKWEHLDQPSATSSWNKYTINIKSSDVPGAAGAGGGDLVATERTIIIFVNQALGANVTAFETALGEWANMNILDW